MSPTPSSSPAPSLPRTSDPSDGNKDGSGELEGVDLLDAARAVVEAYPVYVLERSPPDTREDQEAVDRFARPLRLLCLAVMRRDT